MGQRAAGLAKRGTYTGRIAFNGGEEADVKYRPDGLSPVLLIKVPRTVHKSRPLGIMLSVWDCYCYFTFANTHVIYSFAGIIRDATQPRRFKWRSLNSYIWLIECPALLVYSTGIWLS